MASFSYYAANAQHTIFIIHSSNLLYPMMSTSFMKPVVICEGGGGGGLDGEIDG